MLTKNTFPGGRIMKSGLVLSCFPQKITPSTYSCVEVTDIFSRPAGEGAELCWPFLSKGHKVWEWRFHKDSNSLLHLQGAVMDIYTPSLVLLYANQPNFWTCSRIGTVCKEVSNVCSVKSVALAVHNILSTAQAVPAAKPTLNLWSVLEEWGETWIWDNLTVQGDTAWLADAIADKTLVAVTNGSYMKEIYPDIKSAAFFF